MASANGPEVSRLSSEYDVLRQPVPVPDLLRRGTASTTSSAQTLPPGHWTFPISGNCPKCHHHHRSLKVHVKKSDDASGLADVHCEKCDKLWIASGRSNSTRISLASVETLDPPPMEPEARTALFYAIRSVTRVGSLSSDLPDIPETVAGPSRAPSARDPTRNNAQEIPTALSREASAAAFATTAKSPPPTTAPPNRVLKMNTANTKAVRTRQLISSLKRRIAATRLSRLPLVTKLLGEGALATTACPHNSFSSPVTVPAAVSVKLPTIARPTEARLAQASLAKEVGDAVAEDERAGGLKGRALTAAFDREAVLAMNSQQRFAYLRARITALSAQLTESELSLTTISESERDGFLNHLAEELRGIGDVFVRDSYGDIFGDIDSAAPRSSLQISERISEAATVVDGQIFAPDNLLREVLHRAWRMSSGSAPPPPQGTHISLEEDRLRISSD